LRITDEVFPPLVRPYAGTGRPPYQHIPFLQGALAKKKRGRSAKNTPKPPVEPAVLEKQAAEGAAVSLDKLTKKMRVGMQEKTVRDIFMCEKAANYILMSRT
jgi:hypothetical protein